MGRLSAHPIQLLLPLRMRRPPVRSVVMKKSWSMETGCLIGRTPTWGLPIAMVTGPATLSLRLRVQEYTGITVPSQDRHPTGFITKNEVASDEGTAGAARRQESVRWRISHRAGASLPLWAVF